MRKTISSKPKKRNRETSLKKRIKELEISISEARWHLTVVKQDMEEKVQRIIRLEEALQASRDENSAARLAYEAEKQKLMWLAGERELEHLQYLERVDDVWQRDLSRQALELKQVREELATMTSRHDALSDELTSCYRGGHLIQLILAQQLTDQLNPKPK